MILPRFLFCISFVFLLGPFKSDSQNTIINKPMGIPLVYIMPDENAEGENIMGIMPGTTWRVFVVRQNALTYAYHDKKTVKGKVSFLESMYVTNINGDMLHVYSDTMINREDYTLSKKAVDKGWVDKNDCLIWQHCQISSATKQSFQALSGSQASLLDLGSGNQGTSDGVNLFYDPDLRIKSSSKTKVFQLYYIYKKTAKALLIGTDRKIGATENAQDIILGWIPVSYSFILQNRIWYEPNQDPDARQEQAAKKRIPTLFIDLRKAEEFQEGKSVGNTFTAWEDTCKTQYPPTWFRFPMISNTKGILCLKIIEKDFSTAYTPVKLKDHSYPLFREVTLINNLELSEVISNMNKIVESASLDHGRKSLQKTMASLMEDEFSGLEEERLYNLTLKQIFQNLFWVCNSESPVLQRTFKEIQDPRVVSTGDLDQMVGEIKVKAKNLSKIATLDMDQYSFLSNNMRYFWIQPQQFY
jgi:hypothetical protein